MDPSLLKVLKQIVDEKGRQLVDEFYDDLLNSSQSLPHSFRNTDMEAQKERMVEGLEMAVSLFTEGKNASGYLKDLGMRHIAYEVEDNHYPLVEKVLTEVLNRYGRTYLEGFDGGEFSQAVVNGMRAGASGLLKVS